MGRLVPEAKRNDVRELIFQNYRIMYLVKTDHIYVVAVIHCSRDLTNKTNNPWEIE
jgi:plasmid stabilization system protein ParE